MVPYPQYLPFASWKSLLLGGVALSAVYTIGAFLYRLFIAPLFSSLRELPGPKSPSILWGNFREIYKAEQGELHSKWVQEYGPTLVYRILFNRDRLMTYDTKALSHILNHSYIWQKPEEVRSTLAQLLGEGVLFAEGDSHKRQRRVMNPSFSQSHIRELTSIFHEKSQQLRDILVAQASENGGSSALDIMPWIGKATLDIIGLAGFDYEFNALNPRGEENELSIAFGTIVRQSSRLTVLAILQAFIPQLRGLPTSRNRSVRKATKVMSRIGQKVVQDKKAAILATAVTQDKTDPSQTHIEKSSITTRDILSRLTAANMATDLPENQRLSDEDVLAQIPTFLVAGNDTTSTATTWCLYALCRNPAVQRKLRDELAAVESDSPTMDELNALPYLDAVIRETLRLHAPVSATVRVATKDDVVPLAVPFKDKKGQLRHEIVVRKGETAFIPIFSMNTWTELWGEDAREFRPERWQHLPESVNEVPSIYKGLMTFLGGPRSCIGYRFALIEFKCLVFALIRALQFELADPSLEIVKKANIVTRPMVKSEPDKGAQLPLRITPIRGV